MIAAVWHGPGDLRVQEREEPQASAGSMIVKVQACAICGSDLRILREGNERIVAPRIIGHEIAGEIVEIGSDVTGYNLGDKVSTGADVPCGECEYCISGLPNSCAINYAIGYQFDGGFAEYVRLDHRVVKYGPLQTFGADLPWSHAALAEPLACCINGFDQALTDLKKPRSAVIVGAGPIGLMLIKLAKKVYNIGTVIAVEPAPLRRQKAAEVGADIVIDPSIVSTVDAVRTNTNGIGVELVFTACPVFEVHEQALEMVAPNGVVNLFGGIGKAEPPLEVFSNYIHYKQIFLTGSHGSTPAQHKRALWLIEHNRISVDDLITHEIGIDDIHEGFKLASAGKASKVVIKPQR
jgi:L-iditol 2-dehydrogenase